MQEEVVQEWLHGLRVLQREPRKRARKEKKDDASTEQTSDTERRSLLHNLHSLAWEYGLPSQLIHQIVELITDDNAEEDMSKKLLKCLVPRERVQEESIIQLLGAFGSFSLGLRAAVLQWIVVVYDLLASTTVLHSLYGVLFHYLDFETLRPLLCNLLYRLTRREDVRPFRLRKLYALQSRNGSEAGLVGLLSLYKQYFPQDVAAALPKNPSALLKVPDRPLHQRITELHSQPVPGEKPAAPSHIISPIVRMMLPALSTSTSLVPLPRRFHKIGLNEILSIDQFASHLDSLELPSQLAAVLHSKWLQHYIALDPQKPLLNRISHWLAFVLEEVFYWKDSAASPSPVITLLMKHLCVLAEFLQETPTIVETFLQNFLHTWDGRNHFDPILQLISLMRPCPFEELYCSFLKPLYRLYLSSLPREMATYINCFTRLIRRWASIVGIGEEGESYVFPSSPTPTDTQNALLELVKYVDKMCTIALSAHHNHLLIQHAALSFYETVSRLAAGYGVGFVVEPSSSVVYRLLCGGNAASLSRLCGILARYKKEWEKQRARSRATGRIQLEGVSITNSYIWDLCNSLWRGNLFPAHPSGTVKSRFLPLPPEVTKALTTDAGGSLSLVQGSAFCMLAQDYITSNMPSQKALSLEALKAEIRIRRDYVEWLESKGLRGLYQFLHLYVGVFQQPK